MSRVTFIVSTSKARYFLLLIVFVAVLLFLISLRSIYPPRQINKSASFMTSKNISDFWKTHYFLSKSVPPDFAAKTNNITVITGTKKVLGLDIFYREAASPGCESLACDNTQSIHVLLLHGKMFSSKTWFDDNLKTLQYLSLMGHRAVAVDLPGYGESKTRLKDTSHVEFLRELISVFGLIKPAIVSPSMSGTYSIPYLGKYWQDMSAYIPVAPVGTDLIDDAEVKTITLPTLVVYGELDRGLGTTSAIKFGKMPCSVLAEIPKGAHPAYLTDPDRFHQLLYNFLDAVNHKKSTPVLA